MASIKIFLLQSPKIIHDSSPCRLPYQKAEALLYYLAIEKRATREQAASLLWDQCDEAAARKNLRHAIFTVKKALGEAVSYTHLPVQYTGRFPWKNTPSVC